MTVHHEDCCMACCLSRQRRRSPITSVISCEEVHAFKNRHWSGTVCLATSSVMMLQACYLIQQAMTKTYKWRYACLSHLQALKAQDESCLDRCQNHSKRIPAHLGCCPLRPCIRLLAHHHRRTCFPRLIEYQDIILVTRSTAQDPMPFNSLKNVNLSSRKQLTWGQTTLPCLCCSSEHHPYYARRMVLHLSVTSTL